MQDDDHYRDFIKGKAAMASIKLDDFLAKPKEEQDYLLLWWAFNDYARYLKDEIEKSPTIKKHINSFLGVTGILIVIAAYILSGGDYYWAPEFLREIIRVFWALVAIAAFPILVSYVRWNAEPFYFQLRNTSEVNAKAEEICNTYRIDIAEFKRFARIPGK